MTRRTGDAGEQDTARRHRRVGLSLAGLVVCMVALSFAAVPLYQIFCQVTGFGGTTQRAEKPADRVLDRTITVRFDANVERGLPWRFRPVQPSIKIKIGETGLAFYEAENTTDRAVVGTATFNVAPAAAGAYFSKIECFCFVEQTLKPGERVDMPVTFFVDPAIADDPEAAAITEITLSYTFFHAAGSPDLASARHETDGDGS